mmetsp:Transcript_20081/g.32324  ORF Transcript_20081/g.32324 Transcript_20081/m.32324 type:complete len:357 (-) Transcript_20081:1324-2394(-)
MNVLHEVGHLDIRVFWFFARVRGKCSNPTVVLIVCNTLHLFVVNKVLSLTTHGVVQVKTLATNDKEQGHTLGLGVEGDNAVSADETVVGREILSCTFQELTTSILDTQQVTGILDENLGLTHLVLLDTALRENISCRLAGVRLPVVRALNGALEFSSKLIIGHAEGVSGTTHNQVLSNAQVADLGNHHVAFKHTSALHFVGLDTANVVLVVLLEGLHKGGHRLFVLHAGRRRPLVRRAAVVHSWVTLEQRLGNRVARGVVDHLHKIREEGILVGVKHTVGVILDDTSIVMNLKDARLSTSRDGKLVRANVRLELLVQCRVVRLREDALLVNEGEHTATTVDQLNNRAVIEEVHGDP